MVIKTITDGAIQTKQSHAIPLLPLKQDVETKSILIKLKTASRALAELKGVAQTIPNQNILINTLALQEAKDSSAVENIITTYDELYQYDSTNKNFINSIAEKEIFLYKEALQYGFEEVKKSGLLINSLIIDIQAKIEGNNAGFRSQCGTILRNDSTGEVIYTPPQDHETITTHMTNLEKFINDSLISELDPLIKMAIIHHTFESIHPFFDGNGRTGRIINILYLVKEDLLDLPILYLSRYINNNRSTYYQLLQNVRETGAWENWILFMLDGVEKTSIQTISLIKSIRNLIQGHKEHIKSKLPKIYNHDLINNLFNHPYTKISFVEKDMGVQRKTATKYLDELEKIGLLKKEKRGKETFYINIELYNLLSNIIPL